MSYILDALRKADAERDRGNVPGIHAQPTFGDARPGGPPAKSRTAITIAFVAFAAAVVVVALVALGGFLPWFFMSRSAPPTPAATSVGPAPVPAPVAVAPAPVAPAVALPIEAPKPRVESAPVVRKPKPAAPAAASAAVTPDAKPAATAERVYALAELPDEIRGQLPNLAVGGSMYSTKPADRILIINGQVLHEGDSIAPGLVLQQIRLKAALLSFRNYRFTIGF